MEYTVSRAELSQLPVILDIYAGARDFMARAGNPSQWGKTNPPESRLREDIENGNLYVLWEGETVHGVFAFLQWEDPTYGYIEGRRHWGAPTG